MVSYHRLPKKLRGYAKDHQKPEESLLPTAQCCTTTCRLAFWNHCVQHSISKFKDEINLLESILFAPKGSIKYGIILHSRLPNIPSHTAKHFSVDMDFWVKPSGNSLLTQKDTIHIGEVFLSPSHTHTSLLFPQFHSMTPTLLSSYAELQTLDFKSNGSHQNRTWGGWGGGVCARICLPAALGSLTVCLGSKQPSILCFHPP